MPKKLDIYFSPLWTGLLAIALVSCCMITLRDLFTKRLIEGGASGLDLLLRSPWIVREGSKAGSFRIRSQGGDHPDVHCSYRSLAGKQGGTSRRT